MNEPQLFVKKKPIEVEAMRLDADNVQQVFAWIQRFGRRVDLFKWSDDQVELRVFGSTGVFTAHNGDWITHDEDGLFRPWWPAMFHAQYQAVQIEDAEEVAA
jgi:hypothetical protein